MLVGLVGSAGTYAEYVAVSADPPLARVPDDGLDEVVAAALPSGRLHRTRAVVESLEPLGDKTVLIVGAGAGVGYFVTQFAVNAGALVIVNVGTPLRSGCADTALWKLPRWRDRAAGTCPRWSIPRR
ncbi:MAG: hypothetical protein ACXVVQ_22800 [Solirubrobacteraceae bacterium]